MERPATLQEKVFAHLFEAAEIAKFDKMERLEYEESLKNYRDWYSVMKTAQEKGHQKGLEEGREEGRKEGREEGRKEGANEKALDIARQMKQSGIATEMIVRYTGISEEQVNGL